MPGLRKGLNELVTRRKIRRDANVLLEKNPNAARGQLAAGLHAGEQDQLAFAQERNSVANALDFGEHVGRHEDSPAFLFRVLEQDIE